MHTCQSTMRWLPEVILSTRHKAPNCSCLNYLYDAAAHHVLEDPVQVSSPASVNPVVGKTQDQ